MSAATTVILELVYLTGLVGYYTTADGETPRYSFICFSCLSICRVALARSFLVSAVVLIRQESERLLTRRRTARKMSKQKAADEKGGRLIVQRGASGYFFLFGNNSPAILFFFLKFECWTLAVSFGNYKFNEARPVFNQKVYRALTLTRPPLAVEPK